MIDPLIIDVKALLDQEKGDELILKQILRACQNNEVISNYERNYVRKLAEKFLGRTPKFEENRSEEKTLDSTIMHPETSSNQTIETLQTTPRSKYNNKLLLGIGLAIVAVAIIGFSFTVFNTESDVLKTNPLGSTPLSIKTDLLAYQKGDIISINGKSNTLGTVNISIANQIGQIIWSEQIPVKSDGRFSTLTIAGGVGWEQSGTFTIKADIKSETSSNTFSFSV